MNFFKTLSEVLGEGCTATITIAQKDGIFHQSRQFQPEKVPFVACCQRVART